ncbi:unnamed protein product [Caenorhabditis nigoni]
MLHITTMDTSVKVPPLGHWQMLLGGRTEHEDQRKFLLSNRITPHITTMDTSVKVHPLGHWQMLLGGRTEHEDQRKCLLSNRITPHTTTKDVTWKCTLKICRPRNNEEPHPRRDRAITFTSRIKRWDGPDGLMRNQDTTIVTSKFKKMGIIGRNS